MGSAPYVKLKHGGGPTLEVSILCHVVLKAMHIVHDNVG